VAKAMHQAHSRTAALAVVSGITAAHIRLARKKKQTLADEMETKMSMIAQFKDALEKRAMYVKTRDEIAKLPLDVALDLDIFPGDAEKIAYEAVYGKAA
jgi:adenylate kinase